VVGFKFIFSTRSDARFDRKGEKMRDCANSVNLSLSSNHFGFPRECRFGFSVKIFLNADEK